MNPAAMRSRTGCLTCRKRKLKCDELKPVCSQCRKASRECVHADLIAFRNQQNPSMNAGLDDDNNGLKKFYTYKDTFKADQPWVAIPSQVSFVHVHDPWSDDQNDSAASAHTSAHTTAAYQQVAAHSLEALSTAATRNRQGYVSSGAYAGRLASSSSYNVNLSGGPTPGGRRVGLKSISPVTAVSHQNNNINFLLNPAVIDPNLESAFSHDQQSDDMTGISPGGAESQLLEARDESIAESEQKVASLLRNFADTRDAHDADAEDARDEPA